jgi:hypothetical protein
MDRLASALAAGADDDGDEVLGTPFFWIGYGKASALFQNVALPRTFAMTSWI